MYCAPCMNQDFCFNNNYTHSMCVWLGVGANQKVASKLDVIPVLLELLRNDLLDTSHKLCIVMCLAVLTDGNGNSILCIYLLCVVMSNCLVTNCTTINRLMKMVLVFISVRHNNISSSETDASSVWCNIIISVFRLRLIKKCMLFKYKFVYTKWHGFVKYYCWFC